MDDSESEGSIRLDAEEAIDNDWRMRDQRSGTTAEFGVYIFAKVTSNPGKDN